MRTEKILALPKWRPKNRRPPQEFTGPPNSFDCSLKATIAIRPSVFLKFVNPGFLSCLLCHLYPLLTFLSGDFNVLLNLLCYFAF